MDGKKSADRLTESQKKGRGGEDFAAGVLQGLGYQILARNYHSRCGEVDIVARKDGYICFVEVKARRQGGMVEGAQAVTRSKQKKIIATALRYLQQNPLELQPRFDIFSIVTGRAGAVLDYDYLIGAFDSEAYGG